MPTRNLFAVVNLLVTNRLDLPVSVNSLDSHGHRQPEPSGGTEGAQKARPEPSGVGTNFRVKNRRGEAGRVEARGLKATAGKGFLGKGQPALLPMHS